MLLMRRFYSDGVPGFWHLFVEGLLAAFLGTLFAHWLFPLEASLILVFLASIATDDSLDSLLAWNRREIVDNHASPMHMNSLLSIKLLGIFGGATVGFSILGLGLPLDTIDVLFNHQIADYAGQSFKLLEFGDVPTLCVLNLYVLLFFFTIAIPFHHGGLMLALVWNASVWGGTFGVLARRWSETDGLSLAGCYLRVMAACVPHMVLEACAYMLAGLAGVFLGRGLMRHSPTSELMFAITRSVVKMVLISLLLLLAGAVWEAMMAPLLVKLVSTVS